MTHPKSSAVRIGILGILSLIGGWIFHQQFQFNPAVTVLSQSAVSGGPAVPAPSGHPGGAETAPSAAGRSGPIIRLTAPLSPLSPAEHFDAVTLSDKIDGKAELYLPSGFMAMDCQRFKALNSGIWLEVFIYDMGLPENAFSVFSRQKRENGTPLDLAPYAYQTENALFLTHGRYYLEMIASDPSPPVLEWMAELARAFISDRPDLSPQKMAVPDLFPTGPGKTGSGSQGPDSGAPQFILDRESITLVATDAFGFDQFDQVYTAGYRVNGADISAYISKRESPQEAETLALAYADFLEKFGGSPMAPPMDMTEKDSVILHGVVIMDTVEMVFSVGPYLAGVREAEDPGIAQTLARALILSLEKQGTDPP